MHRFDVIGDWNTLVVLQLDPHEVDGDDDPIVTSLYHTHQPKIEIRQNFPSRDMHASFVIERSHRSIDTRQPPLTPTVYVPTRLGRLWRVGLLRSSYRALQLRPRGRY